MTPSEQWTFSKLSLAEQDAHHAALAAWVNGCDCRDSHCSCHQPRAPGTTVAPVFLDPRVEKELWIVLNPPCADNAGTRLGRAERMRLAAAAVASRDEREAAEARRLAKPTGVDEVLPHLLFRHLSAREEAPRVSVDVLYEAMDEIAREEAPRVSVDVLYEAMGEAAGEVEYVQTHATPTYSFALAAQRAV